jgi:two-component system, response regulator
MLSKVRKVSMLQEKVILLVEDNPDDERLTMRGFKENGIENEIIVARDGTEAIDFFEQKGRFVSLNKVPQVVVLDLKLPKIDGIDVLRYIRSNTSTQFLPVVILTSSKEEKDLIDSYKLGVNAYVQKPIDFLAFTEAVKYLGVFWLLLNEAPMQGVEALTR